MRGAIVLLFLLIGLSVFALEIHTEPAKVPVLSVKDIIKTKESKKFKFVILLIPTFAEDVFSFSGVKIEIKFNELPPVDNY